MSFPSPFLANQSILEYNKTYQQLLDMSLDSLGQRVWANCLLIIFGCIATFSNAIVVITIWKSKTLHSKCFVLIGVNAMNDALLGVAYVITASMRLYHYFSGVGEVMTRWDCFKKIPFDVFFQVTSLAMAAILVSDRSMAVFYPIAYKKLSYQRLTILLILGAIFYSILLVLANFLDAYFDPTDLIVFSCGVDDIVPDNVLIALVTVQIVISVFIVSLNFALAMAIKRKKTKVHPQKKAAREEKVFRSITVTVIMNIIVYFFGYLAILIAARHLSDANQVMTFRYIRDTVVVSAAVNFAIIFFTSSEFRNAVRKLYFKKNTVNAS